MSIQDPTDRTYSNAAENALNLIAEACGFAREWDYPLQIVRDVEDRMRELAALKAASPGERAVEPKDSGESRGNENDSEHRTSSGSATQRQAHRESGMERQGDVARASGTRSAQQDDGALRLHEDGAGRTDSVAVLAGGPAGDGLGNRDVAPLVDPAPGERVPGGGPLAEPIASITHHLLCEVGPGGEEASFYSLDFVLAGDYDYLVEAEEALAKHIAIVQGGTTICQRCTARAAAPAVSPPLRDESVPPPGWTWWRLPLEHGKRQRVVVRVEGGPIRTLAKAWAQYDSEHGYAPAAPSTREGPGERAGIFAEIDAERRRQDVKWGPVRRQPDVDPVLAARGAPGQRICEEHEIPSEARAKFLCQNAERRGECSFTAIVVEELSEAVEKYSDIPAMRVELIQLAASVVKWIEAVGLDAALSSTGGADVDAFGGKAGR